MKIRAMMAAMLLAGLGSGSAAAAPLQWDCDTPEGSFSELSQIQAGPSYRVRGTISWRQSRRHARWAPSAQIRIENGDRSRSIAVQMLGVHGERQIAFGIASSNGGETNRRTLGSAGLEEGVPFEIEVLATGQATVTIGGQSTAVQVDLGPGAKVYAVCSTGEFLFGGLDFGG